MEGGHMVPEFKKVADVWPAISAILHFPKSEEDFNQLVELADYIIDVSRGAEDHPLSGLLDIVGTIIEAYEKLNLPDTVGDPIICLKDLMNEHGLKQKDLIPELGSPGVISEILSGKRELNKRQIKALSARFNCNPAVFM
jgi:HTH-type transcriptional regulator / antitoxin HigA